MTSSWGCCFDRQTAAGNVVFLADVLKLCVQLETIYVLEGLGPPKEHAPGTKSFRDQVGPHCPHCKPQCCF